MLMEKDRVFTMKEIAAFAGVAKSTVSEVVNNNPKSRVSAKTFMKVKRIIDKCGYVPQGAARALSTRRTYQIGFLISSRVPLGLSNSYFATIESGVSEACKKHDYQMLVSTYDLSDIKKFIMPQKLRQRSIDALIVAGTVSQEVLAELKSQNIPFIIIGGEYDNDTLCFKVDMQTTYANLIESMINLGHRSFCYVSSEKSDNCAFEDAMSRVRKTTSEALKFKNELSLVANEYEYGIELAKLWIKTPVAKRFTVLSSSDQTCCGFLSELLRYNIKCPDEVSVISFGDTSVCKWSPIPISAVSFPLVEYGFITANLLIDVLEGRKQLADVKVALKKEYRPHDLIVRQTTGQAPKL